MAARWLASALEAAYDGWPEPVRGSVAVNAILPEVDASHLVAAPGATVKVKVGGDLAADEARVAAVRAAIGPQGRIRIDANAAWSFDEAVAALTLLERAAGGLEYVEQPLASLAQLAALRERTGVPIAVDESIRLATDPFDPALTAMIRNSADVAVLKVAPLGGVANVLRLAASLRMPVVVSGAMETSVGLAAGIAAACALPEEPLACGLGTGTLLAGDVIGAPVVPQAGTLSPMRVAPDADALNALRPAPAEETRLRQRLVDAWEHL